MHVYCEGILDLEDIDGIHVLLTSECMGELIYFRTLPTDALRLRVEITSRRWRRPFSVVIIVSCERFGPKSSSVPGRGWQCAGENAYAAARIFVLTPCLPVRASRALVALAISASKKNRPHLVRAVPVAGKSLEFSGYSDRCFGIVCLWVCKDTTLLPHHLPSVP